MLLLTKVKQFSNLLKIKKKQTDFTLLAVISLQDMLMADLKIKSCP